MTDVSIIIVNWNTRDILRDCLLSVYAQTQALTYELIVVDNASSDGSAEMVKHEFPLVTLITNSENCGFGVANNQGMRIARGRFVLLLNSDTLVLDGAIQKTLHYADKNPEVGVIGCQAVWPDGRRQNTCLRFANLSLLALSSLLFFREAKPFQIPLLHPDRYLNLDLEQEHNVDIVAGCFFFVRQDVIDKVGMFDEDFFMYGEEAEWCFRILQAGWLIRYFPGAKIVHLYGASSFQVEDVTRINKRKGVLLFMHKTRGLMYAWLANLIMTLGVLLRIPFWVIEDAYQLIAHRKPLRVWDKRMKVIGFHFAGFFAPVWK
ncbi:glycosyltransferase family 2 protein [Candidatus Roizmanbacteria bacterium]|nr:glycosyltransferase family 2 protein [Candidatus Roizmanbacteria bacterium]